MVGPNSSDQGSVFPVTFSVRESSSFVMIGLSHSVLLSVTSCCNY